MHAYVITAPSIEKAPIDSLFKIQSVDVLHSTTDSFTIGDARDLVHTAFLKPVESNTRVFVICFQSITIEAQNALLKLLEEPPESAVFYIIVPSESLLIPTLRSRLLQIDSHESSETTTENADIFLAMSYAERLEIIAKKNKEKDTAWMQTVLREINAVIHNPLQTSQTGPIEALAFTESYLGIRGASKKMLLENLALSLPISS